MCSFPPYVLFSFKRTFDGIDWLLKSLHQTLERRARWWKGIPEQIVKEINFQANVLFSFYLMMSLEVMNFFYTICQESISLLRSSTGAFLIND